MAYTKQTWANAPATTSPLSAARLNYIEDGIEATAGVADTAVQPGDPLADLDTAVTGAQLDALKTKIDGVEASADVTDAGNVGTAINGATGKTTPVDADELGLIDSAASNVLKKLTWANLKATAKTYFDTLYVTIGGTLGTPSSGTLTNCTGLPVGSVVGDTTTALGVGSINLGHASDTTIARASAGNITVEGNAIYRAGGTDVPVADGGTGRSTSTTAYGLIAAGTTATGAHQTLAAGATTTILVGGGASALPVWTTATGTGAPVRATSPALTTPTGIVKGDVGLGNVDNTSNATERAATRTLTNARVTPRVSTTTSSATPTINTDTVDMYGLTAQAANITSFTTNLAGTPTDGQKLWIYIKGTAARTIAWGASFEAGPVALPTTTVTTERLDVGFVWNAASSKWRCCASGSAA